MAEAGNVKERIAALENSAGGKLAELEAEMQENQDLTNSIIQLLNGIALQLQEALNSGNITERIIALKNQLDARNESIAAAIQANTEPTEEEEEELPEGETEQPVDHPPSDTDETGRVQQ